MKYSPETKIEAKRLFVFENKSCSEIAKQLAADGFEPVPHANTIQHWSKEKHTKTGKTWKDERIELQDQKFLAISPQNIAGKILERIYKIFDGENFSTKDADALAKLQKVLEKIVDKKYQIPVMYQMLEELALFIEQNHPKANTPEVIAALRGYKNKKRNELMQL